ncbi:MAG: MFS transporter, partial [Acidimicrobiales bacterium]
VLALLKARSLTGFVLFPEAFGNLVLSKHYLVTKAAHVPSLIGEGEDLAGATAKLAVLAALAGFIISPIGIGFLQLGAPWVLRIGFLVFVAGGLGALRLPRPDALAPVQPLGTAEDGRPLYGPARPGKPRPSPAEAGLASRPGGLIYELGGGHKSKAPRINVAKERKRLGLPLIVPEVTLSLGAMTVLRGAFGFMAFFMAFELRSDHVATWWYGFVLVASGVGGLAGSMSVPTVRRHLSEQQLILACLVLSAVAGVACGLSGALYVQPVLALVIGYSSTAAKPAFDSIAQQHVPPAALGRAFARFETQLQLVWVLSALVAVVISFPFRAGDVLIGAACAIAAVFHMSMRHSIGRRSPRRRRSGHQDVPREPGFGYDTAVPGLRRPEGRPG